MYVVVDKQTQKVIHINPAPLIQHLNGKDVYFDFDPETMAIGKADLPKLPEKFKISEDGMLREWTLQEKYEAGLITLSPTEKIEGKQIVLKTISEQVKDGVLKLTPSEKIVGDGRNEQIVAKTLTEQLREGTLTLKPNEKLIGESAHEQIVSKPLSEQVAQGMLELLPSQKIIGEGSSERIVEKSLSEKVRDGLVVLAPTQKIAGQGYGEEIVEKTKQELLKEGLVTLAELQENAVRRLRFEVATYYEKHKTPNNYRLDQLARQKASFSYQFLSAPKSNKTKQDLLSKGLIYPDAILEEIVDEIEKVQQAYSKSIAALNNAADEKDPVAALDSISLSKYLDS